MTSKSSCNNKHLAFKIEEIDVMMSSCCVYCSHHDKECVCSDKSIKCFKCCQLSYHCVVDSTPSDCDWQNLKAACNKLKLEETKAFKTVQAASAKLLYLQKQKHLLYDCAGKFLESGLQLLEELEHLKKKEQKRVAEQAEIQ
ncbi:predicted protein [Uncinocarpus reesii 1704]|uniref:Uncharacterized protein n=1 Tax=Uncinocarpus reesii (strain UAMH 1704) TaxID=336963 RepID=C4JLH0_UNCRE|nr:uncharacterized protein UREG_03678 [Uncinocarpus reesii 1704]EEP78832.1 predicted protein [Uncinocarpus reesii 1704]